MIHELIARLGDLYGQYGYLIVFLGTLGENTAFVGLILPGGTLALLGAFYARAGALNIGLVILVAWIGTVLGYHVDYLLGRFVLGRYAPALSKSRLGRRLRLGGRLRLGQRLLRKYGGRTIFISHAIGHLRSFVALSAGATHMPYRRFLGYELVAALFWTGGYCLLGYFLGAELQAYEGVIERWGFALAGALVVLYLGWRMIRGRMHGRMRRRLRHTARHRPALLSRAYASFSSAREVVGADAQAMAELEAVGSLALALHAGVEAQLLAAEPLRLRHQPAQEGAGVDLVTARLVGDEIIHVEDMSPGERAQRAESCHPAEPAAPSVKEPASR